MQAPIGALAGPRQSGPPRTNREQALRVAIQTIDSAGDWNAARAQAQALCADNHAPVFVTPGWLDAAWAWRAPSARLQVLLAHGADGRVGFVPLAVKRESLLGLPSRVLQFVTVPDTQFADLVCAEPAAPALCRALAEHLSAHRNEWDLLRLHYLSDRYCNWRHLARALELCGISCRVEASGMNPYIELHGSFDEYYGARSRSLKKAVNLSGNRLAKLGPTSVEWVREGAGVGSALADAIRVSSLSWKQDTGNSLDRVGPRAFIERLTETAARSGQLSLWLLRVSGLVIATEYQVIAGGDVHALRSDFDPAFADASPGTFLNHWLLTQLFGCGLHRYYMGPGTNAYKLRWTELGEPMYRLAAYSPSARGRLLRWLDQTARPVASRWRDRLRHLPRKNVETQA